jgi:hypothetical protein
MADELGNPDQDLARVERVIKQYEGILRTSVDPGQHERVFEKLKSLRSYRDKLRRAFEVAEPKANADAAESDPPQDEPYLVLARSLCGNERQDIDRDTAILVLYLHCFGREMLVLLSERQLKLDFKYSLDRDAFYRRYQELDRRVEDLVQEVLRAERGEHRPDLRQEALKRTFTMRRTAAVEAHKYFKSVVRFATDLIEDIETEGFKCLNGTATVRFDAVEGKRHLDGVTVLDALKQVRGYAAEAVGFLNVPDFEAQE